MVLKVQSDQGCSTAINCLCAVNFVHAPYLRDLTRPFVKEKTKRDQSSINPPPLLLCCTKKLCFWKVQKPVSLSNITAAKPFLQDYPISLPELLQKLPIFPKLLRHLLTALQPPSYNLPSPNVSPPRGVVHCFLNRSSWSNTEPESQSIPHLSCLDCCSPEPVEKDGKEGRTPSSIPRLVSIHPLSTCCGVPVVPSLLKTVTSSLRFRRMPS